MRYNFKVLFVLTVLTTLTSCSDTNSTPRAGGSPPANVGQLETKAFLLAQEPWTTLQESYKEQEAKSRSISEESEFLSTVAERASVSIQALDHCFTKDTYGAQEVDACMYNLNGQNQIIKNYDRQLEDLTNRNFDLKNSFVDEIAAYGRKCLLQLALDPNLTDSEQSVVQTRYEEQCNARISSIATGALHYKAASDVVAPNECVFDTAVSTAGDVSAALTTCEAAIKISASSKKLVVAFEQQDEVITLAEKIRIRMPFLKRKFAEFGIPK